MPVGERQADFGRAASTFGIPLVSATLEGLTDAGHLALPRSASAEIRLLARIFDALRGDAVDLASGSHRPLVVDWFHDASGTVIETDEFQHFTTDRLRTLELYPKDLPLGFDPSEYQGLCHANRTLADRYRRSKEARGFRRDGGRRAQRAYFDAVRDIAIPALGFAPVIRVPIVDSIDGRSAFTRASSDIKRRLAQHTDAE